MKRKKVPLAVGQLRQWRGLPKSPWGEDHPSEALIFRVKTVEDEDADGEYQPDGGFCSAPVEHMEKFSVLLEEAA